MKGRKERGKKEEEGKREREGEICCLMMTHLNM